ncbi:MAG: autotransporter-associated beta strand repeat-containing protein, partial [Verrucomicrobiota bacterium]|nr:autotransporter-associated beta strand repeat-containing protein [Verrucomicrobiota bacterium]
TAGSTHVTYTPGVGYRPLAVSEYATDFTGPATNNVRISGDFAAPSGSTANALLFAPAVAATLSGGPINVTSGSFIYSPTVSSTGTVSAGLNFGAAEGVIFTTATLTISGVIDGTNGLTFASPSASALTLTGLNTYTGNTQVNAGQLTFSGTIGSGPGPVGQGTGALILNVGSATARIWVNGDTTINRNLIVQGTPNPFFIAGFGSTVNFNITMNGNVSLQRRLAIENGSLPTTFNGVISGPGSLTDSFSSLVVLNGNNTYSGGTEISTGTYELGSDTGFGTGTVYINSTGTIRGGGVANRTIGNNFLYEANPTFSGTAPLNLTGTTDLNGNRTITTTNTATTTISGLVTNGGLTKAGTGILALTSSTGNSYTGGTIVNAGTLLVNNTSGSGTGSGTVSIAAAGTLSGTFSVSGLTSIAGNFTPAGNGNTGTDNFGNALTFASTAVSTFELGGAGAGQFDHVNVAQLLTLSGTINVVTINGFVAQNGMSFSLFSFGSINASGFNIANLNTSGAQTAPGTFFDTSTFTTNGIITVVPEPSTFAMMGVGASMLVAMMRFRRRSS